MHRMVCYGAALSLIGSFGALAQEPSLSQAQQQSFPAQPQAPAEPSGPPGTTMAPPLTQPQAPLADQAAPAAVGPAQANTAGGTDNEFPLGATRQTMPSTISKENAALDKLPTTALQLPLTNEQKELIAKSLATASRTPSSAEMTDAHVASFLPIGASIQEFAGELRQQLPRLNQYKYVKLDGRILIVDPPYLAVVGEINP